MIMIIIKKIIYNEGCEILAPQRVGGDGASNKH